MHASLRALENEKIEEQNRDSRAYADEGEHDAREHDEHERRMPLRVKSRPDHERHERLDDADGERCLAEPYGCLNESLDDCALRRILIGMLPLCQVIGLAAN